MFDPTSRYAALPVLQLPSQAGRTVSYAQARILPQSKTLTALGVAVPAQGERLDLFSARTLSDPLQFWRIADANDAFDPQDLVVPGTPLVVPLPTV
jgi:nucleoid-associated protein YgaU